MNELLQHLHVTPFALSKITGASEAQVASALGGAGSAGTLLKILAALAVKMRVETAAPVALWFPLAEIDALICNNQWRDHMGFMPFYRTRRELREAIVAMLETMTRGAIARKAMKEFHPTITGMRQWQTNTAIQYKQRPSMMDDSLIAVGQELRDDFRAFVRQEIEFAASWFSPVAIMQFGIETVVEGDQVCLRTTKPIPQFARDWIIRGVETWGWVYPTACVFTAFDATIGRSPT